MTVKLHKLRQFGGPGDKLLIGAIYFALFLILLIVLVPILNIIASSFSSSTAVSSGQVGIIPVDFSLEGYEAVFNNTLIMNGFLNSLLYMVVGTIINLALALSAAYALSHKDLAGRSIVTFLFAFTMLFGGGMIPTYMVVDSLGMIDTIWAMVLPGALSVYNMVIARTFMQSSIPEMLYDAASIDGCGYARRFFLIALPLSKALIAVLTLMFAVGHWNSYFGALMYLRTQSKFPLQLVLRQILVMNSFDLSEMTAGMVENMIERQYLANLLKYSVIIVSSAPVMLMYPFIQKHFVKGIMIGSLKG